MEKFIVTIARGFGSGGRTIGKMLADKLGIEFYDKDLIRIASDVSGINEALFGQNDEKTKAGVFGKPGVYKGGVIAPGKSGFISEENLFNYQAMVIKQICEEKSAVIVGRCADYVLSGRKNVVRVFIYADEENCIKNAADVKGITDPKRRSEPSLRPIRNARLTTRRTQAGIGLTRATMTSVLTAATSALKSALRLSAILLRLSWVES